MKNLLLILFVWLVTPCFSQDYNIYGRYGGTWAETMWTYEFYDNGTYSFKTEGHFGNTFSTGHYKIIKDTLILNTVASDSTDNRYHAMHKNGKFIILCDSIFIDLNLGFEYTTGNISTFTKDSTTIEYYKPCTKHFLYHHPKDYRAEDTRLAWDYLTEEEKSDDFYRSLIKSADTHLFYKKYEKALEFYLKASEIKPDEEYPNYRIAEIEKKLGK